MKSKIHLILFTFLSILFYSQRITLTELENLTNKSDGQFSDFAKSKSYESAKSSRYITYSYFGGESSFILQRFYIDESPLPRTMYMVNNRIDYMEIEQELKKNYTIDDNPTITKDNMYFSYIRKDKKIGAVIKINTVENYYQITLTKFY